MAAKANGVRVEEFGWGLPPRVFGKKFGETIYSINLLPFGGFVKLTGEDSEEATSAKDPKSFTSKTPLQRAIILIAGVFMNVVLAVTIFYVFMFVNGFKTFQMPLIFDYDFKFGETTKIGTVISGIQPGSPAEKAGLTLGEAVTAVNGRKVTDITQFKNTLAEYKGEPVKLTLNDLKDTTYTKIRDVQVSPTKDEAGKPIIGVYLGESVSISYEKPLDRVLVGFYHSYNVMGYSLNTLSQMVALSFKTKDISPVSESVSGPVGIYNLVDMVLKYGGPNAWLTLFDYTALMSLSLALVNIMPFPALDGGRVAFVLFEGVTRKKPNPKTEAAFHRLGMFFLLGFLILITIKDVVR
ncbi:MAG: Membrane-associated zinc metalloprotease [candidate division WWE3 bacterium GW2011_GWF2_41_45]|nr:MAG: Membrane-associated zinc metalloprotease [candidate division WWE3 bacterium GW2011_GWC2_41_23]KKS10144.1 MAG: Membrane-associated zinc metalloprotease [candidate division WWE3 bacterium GW2011_GWF2_41_45]KKS19931.1 MAG: Membrane-associated zinc metalloprotease [candidate division WWE3 bacterium GW2011_GWE1_41_72]KKS28239.1 MAG: Membrane-associated zinc metalloprotease [candidate division WWE3 bacterium GW2011_GWC1_42_102]KKS59325.1 MAG: Membrane-associated zinc metalloprotease [candidat